MTFGNVARVVPLFDRKCREGSDIVTDEIHSYAQVISVEMLL